MMHAFGICLLRRAAVRCWNFFFIPFAGHDIMFTTWYIALHQYPLDPSRDLVAKDVVP